MCAVENPLRLQELSSLSDEQLLAFMRENREMIEDLYEHLAELKHGYVQLFMRDGEYDRCDRLSQHLAKRRRHKAKLHAVTS